MDEIIGSIFKAAYENNAGEVKRLVIQEGVDLDVTHPMGGFTALEAACQQDSLKVISVLIELGADVNKKFTKRSVVDVGKILGESETALAHCNSVESARLLVDAGAELNAFDGSGRPPIFWAANRSNIELFCFLHESGARVDFSFDVDGMCVSFVDYIGNKIAGLSDIFGTERTDKQARFLKDMSRVHEIMQSSIRQ